MSGKLYQALVLDYYYFVYSCTPQKFTLAVGNLQLTQTVRQIFNFYPPPNCQKKFACYFFNPLLKGYLPVEYVVSQGTYRGVCERLVKKGFLFYVGPDSRQEYQRTVYTILQISEIKIIYVYVFTKVKMKIRGQSIYMIIKSVGYVQEIWVNDR